MTSCCLHTIVYYGEQNISCEKQCCGAGACGAEIIWGPGVGAENKFK